MSSLPQEEFDALLALYHRGRFDEVVALGGEIVERYPDSSALCMVMGSAHARGGRLPEAIAFFTQAVAIDPTSAEAHGNLGGTMAEAARLDDAIACYAKALELRPDWADAHRNLALALAAAGRTEEAIASLERALALHPNWPEAEYVLGRLLRDAGRNDEAIARFEAVLRVRPDIAEVHNALAHQLAMAGRPDDAIASYGSAVRLAPDWPEAHNDLGNALMQAGRHDEAIERYAKAVQLAPNYAIAHYNLGNAHNAMGRHEEAIACYAKAIAIAPMLAEAHNNLGSVLNAVGRAEEAVRSYGKALEIAPEYAEAHNNLANILKNLDRNEEAIAHYSRALTLNPALSEAHFNLGNVLDAVGRRADAIACYRRALALRPGYAPALAELLLQSAHVCDWSTLADNADCIGTLGVVGEAVSPFAMLALEDDAEHHRIRSARFAAERHPYDKPIVFPRPSRRSERLRIGYFSADFHNHATMHLMARLFELHDRVRFSIHAYSFGPDSPDAMTERLKTAVEGYRDVRSLPNAEIADLAREDGIDIAIDLKGYTRNMRSGIFAHRAAPLQVNYLGYPGTMGAPFIDYIIADRTIIPDDHRRFYAEQVICLPGSYQPNDDSRAISTRPISRREMGLPEEAFVFCCFNNNYKITPQEFDIWMRLLGQVEGSALWLYKGNDFAPANLRREAQKRGIDPLRLVFADRAQLPEHLGRHRLADLFLDTFACNAHTTASDALWAGLPVLTRIGESFAARVAASLLNALDLPELIARSPEEYEHVALALASEPERLAAIRQTLAARRANSSLFDSELYTRRLEAAYDMIWARYLDGLGPISMEVPAE